MALRSRSVLARSRSLCLSLYPFLSLSFSLSLSLSLSLCLALAVYVSLSLSLSPSPGSLAKVTTPQPMPSWTLWRSLRCQFQWRQFRDWKGLLLLHFYKLVLADVDSSCQDDRPWADFPTAERRKDPFSGTAASPAQVRYGSRSPFSALREFLVEQVESGMCVIYHRTGLLRFGKAVLLVFGFNILLKQRLVAVAVAKLMSQQSLRSLGRSPFGLALGWCRRALGRFAAH